MSAEVRKRKEETRLNDQQLEHSHDEAKTSEAGNSL